MVWRLRSLVVAGALALVLAATAAADWGGPDPSRGTRLGQIPYACNANPTGEICVNAGVYYLDKARQRAGLPAYALPADFVSLDATKQMFILTNLDRIAYHLAPIPGMTAQLNHDALVSGVWVDADPHPSHPAGLSVWWPGWAGAFYNVEMAYETWVWNDGLGSTNPRCTRYDHSRCWGHRHSVLWKFGTAPVVAMGAAAAKDSHHHRGFSYLFVGGNAGYPANYSYTWDQAVADGAGTNTYDYGTPPSRMCNVPVVVGDTLNQAERAIEKNHCTVGTIIRKHGMYVPGIVTQQHPPPQRTIPAGSPVSLNVSLGPRR